MPITQGAMSLWSRFQAWRRRSSLQSFQEKRNDAMLQAILGLVGTSALIVALAFYTNPEIAQPGEARTALAISVYAWSGFCLLRAGFYRLSASLTVIGSLLLIGISYYVYGLQAQPDLLMIHLLPLLFAGLLLGRAAVWWTALASTISLAAGALSDMQTAADSRLASDALANLFLSGMNFLVLAVILDRLIQSSQRAIERSRKLDATCVELKREIKEKELAYARLLQTQRMEAIGRLSTGVAHDFNHLLSIIGGLAQSPAGLPADAVLPGIQRAAQRGAVLTRRLLSFSRTEPRNFTVFDLGQALGEMRTLLVPMFHPGIRVNFEVSSPGLMVEADVDELELALLNIASNASDAMPDGGHFNLSLRPAGNHALIRIEDTGTGMPPEVLDRLFEPFFTTKPKNEGTGIGMSIVHRFIVDCGGQITVDSRPGDGTRIELRLPLVEPQPVSRQA